MKIICVGFWKTGTKSLAEALKIIGYKKIYDYDDQFFELADLWSKFYNGTVTDEEIRKSLEDIDVLIDGPVIAFWEEIYRVFPEAKVILTIRDEDSWYKSYKGMYDSIPFSVQALYTAAFFTPLGNALMRSVFKILHFCQGVEGPFRISTPTSTDKARLYKLKFRKHNCYVRYTVEKYKLLVYEAEDGWEPLCKFLGDNVPVDTPYPVKNQFGAHMKSEGGPKNPKFKKMFLQSSIVLVIFCLLILYAFYQIILYLFGL